MVTSTQVKGVVRARTGGEETDKRNSWTMNRFVVRKER